MACHNRQAFCFARKNEVRSMNTNQLGNAADAAWQGYERAVLTWVDTLVAAEGGKHSTDLGDGYTLTSRLRCASNIPSPIKGPETWALRSERENPAGNWGCP